MNRHECYGIIPARFNSTRFPGKPMTDILGKPMFWHVYNRASQCSKLKQVVLATDNNTIFAKAKQLDVPVVMTRNDHPSGTDRVMEAAQILNLPDHAVIVNIQGDEPAIEPDMLSELVDPFSNPVVQVTTLARKIDSKQAASADQVKVVFSKSNHALYFSRSLIPYGVDTDTYTYYGHIGLYAFRMKSLKKFVTLEQSSLEIAEKLEQLRLIENDIPVHVVVTAHKSVSVDRPEDLKKVLEILG